MSESMIDQSVSRLFSAHVDAAIRQRSEEGIFPQALWTLVSDNGFDAAVADEAHGGIAAKWADAYGLLRGIGYWQVPLPLAETLIGTALLSIADIERPPGPGTVVEQGLDNSFVTSGEGAAERWSGTAHRVHWARHTPWMVVSRTGGGIALLDLRDGDAVKILPRANTAGIPADTVILEGARTMASVDDLLSGFARPVWTLAAMARSAMMVGALERAFELSIQYAKDRVQFGRAIGRNQAVQQQLAQMAGEVVAARVAALVAATHAPSTAPADRGSATFSTAIAKVRCGEAATRAAAIAHQVHGAIGFTQEHSLQFSTRRLWAWREEFGSESWWAQRLGKSAIAGGSTTFWHGLTSEALMG